AIFDFVGVGACGIGIETDELEEIVNAGDIAIGDVWLDSVLVAFSGLGFVGRDRAEETLQRRGTKVESELPIVAHEGLRADDTGGSEGRSVIGGAKSGSRGGAEPRSKMEGHCYARRELRARNKIRSLDGQVRGTRRETHIVALDGAGEGVKSKIEGQLPPGLLLDRTKPRLRRIAQRHALLRVGIEETVVVDGSDVEA